MSLRVIVKEKYSFSLLLNCKEFKKLKYKTIKIEIKKRYFGFNNEFIHFFILANNYMLSF